MIHPTLIRVYPCKDKADVVRILREEFESGRYDLPKSTNARIVLKPNFNSDMIGLTGNTTDLRLIIGLIEVLKEWGFTNLTIADGTSSGFIDHEIDVLERLRVRDIGRRYGVNVVNLNEDLFNERKTHRGRTIRIARTVLESDFLINLPKLKTHGEARMSAALKNLVGCTTALDKQIIHEALVENIVWLSEQVHSDLIIVDGIVGMEGLGPSLGSPINTNVLLVSNNAYAVEYACAILEGYKDPSELPVIKEIVTRNRVPIDLESALDAVDLAKFAKPFLTRRVGWLARTLNQPWMRPTIVRIRYLSLIRHMVRFRIIAWSLRILGLRQDTFVGNDATIQSLRYVGSEKMHTQFLQVCPMGIDPGAQLNGKIDCIKCMYCYFMLPEGTIHVDGDLGHIKGQVARYRSLLSCGQQT